MMHEAQMHEANSFITLTYDDKNLPENKSLDVEHWQLFAKRLRKRVGKIRFYHCGEYGELRGRPHYHAAIFGCDFSRDRRPMSKTRTGDQLYESDLLTEIWGKGIAAIGDLSFESAAYVARYITKKHLGPNQEEHYHGRKPEYTTMSRMPGIGKSWIDKFMPEVYPRDEVVVNGKLARPPAYYDQQLEKADPEGYRNLKIKRGIEGEKYKENNTEKRLKIRETVVNARRGEFVREL